MIPIPELVAAFAIAAIVLAVRTLRPDRSAPAADVKDDGRRLPAGDGLAPMRARLIASCILIVIISVPLILELIPPNGIYGFRARGTRPPEIWYPANAFMGWALVVAASLAAALQIVLPPTSRRWLLWAAFMLPIAGAVVASLVYLDRLLDAA